MIEEEKIVGYRYCRYCGEMTQKWDYRNSDGWHDIWWMHGDDILCAKDRVTDDDEEDL